MIILNQREVPINRFPNRELNLGEELSRYVNGNDGIQYVTMRYETDEDLMSLYFISSWLKEEGCNHQFLILPYLPYSRMDRKVGEHLFSLKYIANFINSLEFETVAILESHSDVALELINNSVNIPFTEELVRLSMLDIQFDYEKDVIVFPDAGARKRYQDVLSSTIRVLEGSKQRDFNTGDINSLKLTDDGKPIRNVLIVDDLCSRGGTFLEVAAECERLNVQDVYLAVTHLEFNVFTGELFEKVRHVFATNSLEPVLEQAEKHKQITIYDLPVNFQMTLDKRRD